MRFLACLAFVLLLVVPLPASVPYPHVQTTVALEAAPGSRGMTLHVHLRNLGDMATSCTVKAGRQKRMTGLSPEGEADVVFISLRDIKNFIVRCVAN